MNDMNQQSGNSGQLPLDAVGDGDAAELFGMAQLAPGEGIEDAVRRIEEYLAARQPVGVEPVEYQYRFWIEERDTWSGWAPMRKQDYERITKKPEEERQVRALYTAPPAPSAAVPVCQFRDADHLADWLGSLVAACGQEEWDAAQAAMNGIRAFQNHPDAVERLRAAIEGECDGLAISGQQASAILARVMLPEPDGFFATHPQPAATTTREEDAWIDVSERKPEHAQEVLFVLDGKTVAGAWIGGIFWYSNQKHAALWWQPFPKPRIGANARPAAAKDGDA